MPLVSAMREILVRRHVLVWPASPACLLLRLAPRDYLLIGDPIMYICASMMGNSFLSLRMRSSTYVRAYVGGPVV